MWSGGFPSIGGFSKCRGCDHPRSAYTGGYSSVRSNLGTMLTHSKFIGCDVCTILSDGILQFIEDNDCGITRDDVDDLQLDFNLAASRRSIEVVLLRTPVKLTFYASEITPWLTDNMPDLPVGKEVPPKTSSEETLAWAVREIEHCKQNHEACNSFPPAPLPSRVLDVCADSESGVRLYESQGETSPYVALSHCWGHQPFLRTLSGSLEKHKSEIPWSALPRNFQDAVEFTRKMGVRYLWIDSLCIIQDDIEDWRHEAAQMGAVYRNSTLVISAAKSEGAYGGLYAELPEKHRTYTVTFTPGQNDDRSSSSYCNSDAGDDNDNTNNPPKEEATEPPEKIHLRLSLSHPHRLLSTHHAPSSTLPIFSRGWILQERFLSPRILHFGPEELSLECLSSTTCQCMPPPTSSAATTTTTALAAEASAAPDWYTHMLDRTARPKHYYSLPHWRSGALDATALALCWRRLVEDYTHLSLTCEGDVFPAVSGLARQMGSVRPEVGLGGLDGVDGPDGGERYVAGLWTGTLLLGDLLWRVELPPAGYVTSPEAVDQPRGVAAIWGPEAVCRPGKWRAPSWSWGSVRAPVEFENGDGAGVEPACEVVGVRCEPAGEDPMGELKEGGSWLVLKGRLIPTGMRFKKLKKREEVEPWNAIDLDILGTEHLRNLWADDNCRGLVGPDGRLPTVYMLLIGRKLPMKELYCLVLTRVPEDESPLAGERPVQGDGHLYRRIALLEICGGPPRPVEWGWLHELLGKGEDAVVTIV
ncbi:heterokaryon incompatibility protein-domain-containing protein [Chaetomium fimeti]|uniref:Heterokaryon incompatibility protein-domain-containing protein n=1 Tax=Chaetomium fimeti TaxID=1854472 RepID=A0AAE0HBW0_9PEZI|nr:heterokaryon incompatibility protein-domain-containing protein [Chaetomium fimeti]